MAMHGNSMGPQGTAWHGAAQHVTIQGSTTPHGTTRYCTAQFGRSIAMYDTHDVGRTMHNIRHVHEM